VCTAQGCRYADANAAGDRVVLPGANERGVTRVRYAWADPPFINLFSADNLPAAPFLLDLK
jgi:sialate O-acetylesterase